LNKAFKNLKKLNLIKRQFIYSTDSELPLVAVLQPLLSTKNGFNLQYEPSEIVTEYSPRMRNFILGLELGFSNSNILLVIALALLLVVTISLVTIRCRKWRKAHSKGNTSQVRVNTIGDSCTDVGDLKLVIFPICWWQNRDSIKILTSNTRHQHISFPICQYVTNIEFWLLKIICRKIFLRYLFHRIDVWKDFEAETPFKNVFGRFRNNLQKSKNEISTWFLVF